MQDQNTVQGERAGPAAPSQTGQTRLAQRGSSMNPKRPNKDIAHSREGLGSPVVLLTAVLLAGFALLAFIFLSFLP